MSLKLSPRTAELKAWMRCAPTDGDLVFFAKNAIEHVKKLPFPYYSRKQAAAQRLLTLNHSSWYDYSMKRGDSCVWLPPRMLESLDPSSLKRLARAQVDLKIPTLIRASKLNNYRRS
jgi:hypothetical protein